MAMDMVSVAGGYDAWCRDGLPTVPGAHDDADFLERYSRHLRLPQVGLEGQRRLAQSTVLLVGKARPARATAGTRGAWKALSTVRRPRSWAR